MLRRLEGLLIYQIYSHNGNPNFLMHPGTEGDESDRKNEKPFKICPESGVPSPVPRD